VASQQSVEHSEFLTSGVVRLSRSQLIGTMTGLMLGMLLAALDQTIVGTAEPKIIAHLSGFDRYPWVSTTYLLTSTISVPIFAKLSDIYGRKRFFLGASILFVVASALCGASGTLNFLPLDGMNQLVVFRGLQGIGGGMLMALAFTIIGDIFSPAERGRYQALFSAVWGAASVFGPTLGGWLTDKVSWRAVFYVNLPVGIVATLAIYFAFPDFHPQGPRRRLDWAGTGSLIACMVPLLLALTWVTNYGWTSARVESFLAFALVMLAVFIFIEYRAAEPLLPLSLFSDPVIAVSSLAMFILGMGMFAVIVYLPLFMQGVMGVTATRSGNLLLPLMLGVVVGSALSGQAISRLKSYKVSIWVGSIAIALGMVLFARMDGSTRQIDVLRAMVLSGLGMGFVMPAYTVAVQNAAPRKHMGAATSSSMFFRSIGSTLGVAIFGSVLLVHYNRDFASSVPAGVPLEALRPFGNPLMLPQFHDQLVAAFSRLPGGIDLLQVLYGNVRMALIHGLKLIFVSSAILMAGAALLNLLLRDVPLRVHSHAAEAAPPIIEPI
jgi:EmrB/QacA subfamily drug resistance transporter